MVALLAPILAAIALVPGGFQAADAPFRPWTQTTLRRAAPASASISLLASMEGRANKLVTSIANAPAAVVHDYFNLGCISGLVALTAAAWLHAPYNLPLAWCITVYTSIDTLWVMWKPEAVEEPRSLIAHHLMAVAIAFHAATWAPHTHFTSWMSVIEVSTLCAPHD